MNRYTNTKVDITMKKVKMNNRLSTLLLMLCALSISGMSSAYAVGEGVTGTAAGNFAGYGYTHGMIPVMNEVGGSTTHDSDMMRYDRNRRQSSDDYYNMNKKGTVQAVQLLQITQIRSTVYLML